MRRSLSTYTVIYSSLREPRIDGRPALGAMLTVQSKRNRRRLGLVFEIGFKLFSQYVLRFELNLRQTARHWVAMPTVGCSIPIFNLRPNDAPIFQACHDRDLNRVKYLLESGQASIHDVDDKVGGLLEHVVNGKYNHDSRPNDYRIQQLVEHLLDQGCNPNAFYGPIVDVRLPAILHAFINGYFVVVSVLLLRGADIFPLDSILPCCLANTHDSFQWKIDTLRSMGYSDWKPNLPHRLFIPSFTILHGACQSSSIQELLFALEVVGLDPNIQIKNSPLPLEIAITEDFLKGAVILVECGATVRLGAISDTDGITALHHYLLLQGADSELTSVFSSPWQHVLSISCAINAQGAMAIWSFTSLEGNLAHLLAHGSDPSEVVRLWSYISNLDIVTQTEGPTLNFGWTRSGQIGEALSGEQRKRQLGGRTKETRPSLALYPRVGRNELENCPTLGHDTFFRNQTQFPHHTSTAEGRKRLARFPTVLALCDALQFAGYRAEMDDEGDIWYEIDDGDRYFDAREYQNQDGREDWSGEFCPICQDFERHGLGHILEEAEEAKRELREYREKVRATKYRL
ncbi:hypothetical protein GGR51DRAFT_577955 [Nemania sp. FL0031]|nr:hypothetical protein GGR51DRAFT_577955 [Nemania sp. FL0031]